MCQDPLYNMPPFFDSGVTVAVSQIAGGFEPALVFDVPFLQETTEGRKFVGTELLPFLEDPQIRKV